MKNNTKTFFTTLKHIFSSIKDFAEPFMKNCHGWGGSYFKTVQEEQKKIAP